ncbi:Hypothetical protein, putative, partial [Bodo saltans]
GNRGNTDRKGERRQTGGTEGRVPRCLYEALGRENDIDALLKKKKHTLLEEFVHETGQRRSVAVVMRMKTRKRLSAGDMRLWALSAHRHAKEQLKLNDGEYYVALYVSKSLSRVRGWESCMPKGTIVIERTSLKGLLIPFGIAPLLSTMDSNTDN